MTIARIRRVVRRRLLRHRRPVAALCLAAAATSAVHEIRPPPAPVRTVLAAAHDLPSGHPLTAGDLMRLDLPAATVPTGALEPGAPVLGRTLVGPVRRGEALTDARMLGPALLRLGRHDRAMLAVPVRLADPASAQLLRPGDRVDVYAVPADAVAGRSGSVARVIAADVGVVVVPRPPADADGGLVVLAVTSDVAQQLAAAAAFARISVAVRAAP